uniref:Plant/F12B17-70 protein n=1 Tax=Medicago truncatula TaxID=3880 RepID=I3S969_MEDTR|nr:unknown [Medicago truncatula]
MEWQKYYMDMLLVPCGFLILVFYHYWLWHMTRSQPYTTTFGRDADGRRFWVPTMMKDIDNKNLVAVQSLRNLIMGTTLMSTTSILLCAGLGAIISSTYSVKKPIKESVFGAHGEFVVVLKFAIVLTMLSFSFICHTLSAAFINQVNMLISTPQSVKSMVTPEYLTQHLGKAMLLNVVGIRLFYTAITLQLWIFGPLLPFLSSMLMVCILYNLDFVGGDALEC